MAAPYVRRDFHRGVSRWVRGVHASIDAVHKEVLRRGLTYMTRTTPVLSGRARASWRMGFGRVLLDADRRPDIGGFGYAAAAAAGDVVLQWQFVKVRMAPLGGDVWITNNVAYAIPLEDGHSPKGRAMLRGTLKRILSEFDEIVATARRSAWRIA